MDDAPSTGTLAGAVTVVTFPEEAVFSNADMLLDRVASALSPDVRTVIVDLTDTAFCDSSGLRALVIAHRLGQEKGINVRVVVAPHLLRMIAITGLHRVLALYPTVAAARAGAPLVIEPTYRWQR